MSRLLHVIVLDYNIICFYIIELTKLFNCNNPLNETYNYRTCGMGVGQR